MFNFGFIGLFFFNFFFFGFLNNSIIHLFLLLLKNRIMCIVFLLFYLKKPKPRSAFLIVLLMQNQFKTNVIFKLHSITLTNKLIFFHPTVLIFFFFLTLTVLVYKLTFTKLNLKKIVLMLPICLFLGSLWSDQEIFWNGFWNWDQIELSLILLIYFYFIYIHAYKDFSLFFIQLLFIVILFKCLVLYPIQLTPHTFKNALTLKYHTFIFSVLCLLRCSVYWNKLISSTVLLIFWITLGTVDVFVLWTPVWVLYCLWVICNKKNYLLSGFNFILFKTHVLLLGIVILYIGYFYMYNVLFSDFFLIKKAGIIKKSFFYKSTKLSQQYRFFLIKIKSSYINHYYNLFFLKNQFFRV